MTAIQLQKEIRKVYLQMKERAFTDIEDLIEKRDELQMKTMQMVADSGIGGNAALRRMMEIKKQTPILSEEYKEQYELLSMVRKLRVKYFYDNNLVA